MAQDYYPDFYLRKRQRERVYRGIGWAVGLLAVVGLGIFVAVIVWGNILAPRRTQPGATAELASQRQDLETQQKLSEAAKQNLNAGTLAEQTADSQQIELDAIEYASSFPLVQVGLGDGAGATAPVETAGSQEATTDSALSSEQVSPPQQEPAAEPSVPEKPAVKPEEQKQPVKPQETAKKPDSEKREPKKAEKKPEPEAKKPEPAKPAGGYVYRVYAGSTASRESAEKLKSEISNTGVSASIVQSGGDYLLLVGTLEDLDSAMALRNKLVNSGFSGAFTTKKSK